MKMSENRVLSQHERTLINDTNDFLNLIKYEPHSNFIHCVRSYNNTL